MINYKQGKIEFNIDMRKEFSKKTIQKYIKEGMTGIDPKTHDTVDLKFKVSYKGVLLSEFTDSAIIVPRSDGQKEFLSNYIDNKNLYDIMTKQALEKLEELVSDLR